MLGDTKKSFSFELRSNFLVERNALWNHIIGMPNVNKELMPYIRMTYPASRVSLRGSEKLVPFGQTLFVSVLLLFGLIPIDLHWLRLDRIVEGKAFYENSTTLLHKYWKHTRTLTEKGDGVVQLTDELKFLPRIPLLGHLLLPVVKHIFQHRHKQLQKMFISASPCGGV